MAIQDEYTDKYSQIIADNLKQQKMLGKMCVSLHITKQGLFLLDRIQREGRTEAVEYMLENGITLEELKGHRVQAEDLSQLLEKL